MGNWTMRYPDPYGELIGIAGEKLSTSTRRQSDRASNQLHQMSESKCQLVTSMQRAGTSYHKSTQVNIQANVKNENNV